jgi:hypothetical protein
MNVLGAMIDTVQLASKSNKMPCSGPLGYVHLAGMLARMQDGGFSYGKMCRWLGWAQAALVAAGAATLDDVKMISKRHAD